MMRPVVTPVRVEHYLLPLLREAFPDVTFSTIRSRVDPPTNECVLVGEPGQLSTPISQYVRLRMSTYVTRADGSGDFQAAQELAARIEAEILKHSTDAPFVDASHESGPIRIADENMLFAYTIVLLTVTVA
jgi:hypothetical protein